ncbi:MAG: zinc ribbon domain-containing protein [Anaerolineae bacterium]
MPLYEYECEACGVRFERVQSFSEEPLKTCPECGGAVHRVIYPVGIIFKGSGFYVTDSRSKSPTIGAANGKGHEAKGSSEATGSSSSGSATEE